jgi:hypothetical protein
MRHLLALLPLLLAVGCRTERSSAPPELDEAVLLGLHPTGAWEVETEGGHAVGSVVCFEEASPPYRRLFVVRNRHAQDLGRIDARGRAWRDRPHREPDWVGTGTVAEGVGLILGLDRPARLRAVPLSALGRDPSEG